MEREELEKEYGKVWNTGEVTKEFEVTSFLAPLCFVERRADGIKGTLTFQHMPRYYFDFREE